MDQVVILLFAILFISVIALVSIILDAYNRIEVLENDLIDLRHCDVNSLKNRDATLQTRIEELEERLNK